MTMNANVNTKGDELVRDSADVGSEASKAALGTGISLAALIGLWVVACLVGGLAAAGLIGVVTGYIKAVIGM